MVSSADILKAKILVVDDKEANVLLIEGMLRVAGYTSVHSTTDPTRGLRSSSQERYGLILLDLQMPVMDGFQVMEGLKEIESEAICRFLSSPHSPTISCAHWKQGLRTSLASRSIWRS